MDSPVTAVASYAIELSLQGEYFTVEDILSGVENAPNRTSVTRVLDELEAHGWIRQDQDGWKPSVKAQELGNLRSSAVNTSSADFDLGIDGILDSENKQ
jgi:hypothetical protein